MNPFYGTLLYSLIPILVVRSAGKDYEASGEKAPQEKVRAEIEKGMGTQFDPQFAKVMLQMIDEDKDYRLCGK